MNHRRAHIAITSLLLVGMFLSATVPGSATEHHSVTLVFRYDDYSAVSPTALEAKLLAAFRAYDMPCTVAIVPYVTAGAQRNPQVRETMPLPDEKVAILKAAITSGIAEPALHGYSHRALRACRTSECSEFSGLPYEDQKRLLAEGKAFLEGLLNTKVTTFVPPWNTYDLNTLRCLEEVGFECISADPRGILERDLPLRFLPATCTVPELPEAIGSARRSSDADAVVVILLHPSDFAEDNGQGRSAVDRFLSLLDWIQSQKDIRVSSMGQTIQDGDFGPQRFQSNRGCYIAGRLLPPPLLRTFGSYRVYFSSPVGARLQEKMWIVLAVLALVTLGISALILSFVVRAVAYRQLSRVAMAVKAGAVISVVALSIWVFHNLTISYQGLMALLIGLGACLGAWFPVARKPRCSD